MKCPAVRGRAVPALLFAVVLMALLALAGCAGVSIGADPWDRDLLSQPAMQFDSNPARDGNDAHIYFSREASSGGRGFGGGGMRMQLTASPGGVRP